MTTQFSARPDLLDPSTLHEMSLPVDEGYGLGLRLSANAGGVLVGHGGSMPGFMASLFVDPGSSVVVGSSPPPLPRGAGSFPPPPPGPVLSGGGSLPGHGSPPEELNVNEPFVP